MAVLVVADNDNTSLKDNTNKTVTAAKALSGDVDLLVMGQGVDAVAAEAAKIEGVRKVLVAQSDALGKQIAEAQAATVLALAPNYDAILVPATSVGKNFAPRVAAKLDVAPISEIVEVVSPDTFVRPIYAGNALETIQSSDAKKVITVRSTAFKPAGEGGAAPIEKVAGADAGAHTRFVSDELVKSDRPELAGAKIVVFGRGVSAGDRAPGRQAGRGGRREPGRGGRRLCPQRLPGRPDGQGGRAAALYRNRHLGRDPAPGRHEGFKGDRGDQQGP